MMERRLLHKKILTDSRRRLRIGEEEEFGGRPTTPVPRRSRSDSLPNELLFHYKLGKRRQSLPPNPPQGQGVDNTEKLLKEGILKLQNSAKNLDSAKKTVLDILESRRSSGILPSDIEQVKERNKETSHSTTLTQSQEEQGKHNTLPTLCVHPPPPEHPPSHTNSSGSDTHFISRIGRWMRSKWEEKYASRSANKDVKKAVKGVEEAGEVINQMEDSLLKTEEELRVRAMALRRQSADAFKLVSTGIKTVNISYDEEEEDNISSKSGGQHNKSDEDDIDEVIKQLSTATNGHSKYKNKKRFEQVTNL